jgi:hypothetical protein
VAPKPDIQYIQFYIDGSAAKKVAPVVPLKTMKLPKITIRKKIVLRIDPIAICGMIMAAVMLVLMLAGAVRLVNARNELTRMNAYVQTLQEENESLNKTLSEGYNLEEIERTALALGMVPVEQVEHIQLRVPQGAEPEKPGTLEQFYTFLTGLFA